MFTIIINSISNLSKSPRVGVCERFMSPTHLKTTSCHKLALRCCSACRTCIWCQVIVLVPCEVWYTLLTLKTPIMMHGGLSILHSSYGHVILSQLFWTWPWILAVATGLYRHIYIWPIHWWHWASEWWIFVTNFYKIGIGHPLANDDCFYDDGNKNACLTNHMWLTCNNNAKTI